MHINEFDFDLPEHLIAQTPAEKRENSRLLLYQSGKIKDDIFLHIDHYFQPGDVLVINNTKVMNARLKGKKASGGQIEILIERIISSTDALALIRASHPPKTGSILYLAKKITVTVLGRQAQFFLLRFNSLSIKQVLNEIGYLPLPPYINHEVTKEDENRYQTVFAQHIGAAAAPTAGLHFTQDILSKLQTKGVIIAELTLHIGSGTFQPVRTSNIDDHHMHVEHFIIPQETAYQINQALKEKRRICAIGTTSLRALESAVSDGEINLLEGETDIFIKPGYTFQVVNRLLTNFHLPKSTLFILVSAFAGKENIKQLYHHAIQQQYRFFSYGDCMLLENLKSY